MKVSSNTRETLAWILLASAAFLFSVTIALAEDKNGGKTTIKITKKENGKTTKIDTTFDSNEKEAIEKILKDMDLDDHMSFRFSMPKPPSLPGDGQRRMKFHYDGMSKEERDQLKKEMENLDIEMEDLREKMKGIHMEIYYDKDEDDKHGFAYHFEMPPIPDVPEMPDDIDAFDNHGWRKNFRQPFFNAVPESLDDEDHVIIMGDETEAPPVFEKEITGKNGEKVFIYKRSKPVEKISKEIPAGDEDLKLYPNPNNGKF